MLPAALPRNPRTSSDALDIGTISLLIVVVMIACILEGSGVARDLYRAMHVFAGSLPGGLALQTVMVAVIMAAMTGIIGGEIVLLGLIALPQMLYRGYDTKLAIGTICAGGPPGTMIP